MKHVLVCAIALAAAVCGRMSNAATTPYQEYDKLVKSAEMVRPLSSDLFGDDVSLYSGSTQFTTADISIPGNSALPVRLARTFRVELRNDSDSIGGFGAWDLDVPYIYGVFPDDTKWNLSGNTATNRCSQLFYPKVDTPFYLHEVWTGTKVYIPGRGEQSLMWNEANDPARANPQPTDGAGYYWNTRDNLRFKCTGMANYPGQGFIAVDTEGNQYTFNYAIERAGGVMRKIASAWGEVARGRKKIYLMATEVRDRHGNYVQYQYQGDQLRRIVSNDGRAIDINYVNGRIDNASAHGRTWRYEYSPTLGFGQSSAKALTKVIQPDTRTWEYTYNSDLKIMPSLQDGSIGGRACLDPLPDHGSFSLTAKHPSGASGVFNFDYIQHGISGTPATACVLEAVINGQEYWNLVIPDYFYNFALIDKTISGVGLAPRTWRYYYGNPLTGRQYYSMSLLHCLGTCDDAKSQLVVEPDGSRTEYVYGVLFNYNDGRLLATYNRDAQGKILRAEINEYVSDEEVGGLPFKPTFGISSGSFDMSSMYNRPIKNVTVLQGGDIPGPVEFVPPPPPPPPPPPGPVDPDNPPPEPCVPQPPYYICNDPMLVGGGDTSRSSMRASSLAAASSAQLDTGTADVFVKRVETFDHMARPLRVVRESSLGYSRTDQAAYYDDTSRWVMGQSLSSTNLDTGIVESQVEYWPASVLPKRTWQFEKLQSYSEYHADGTLAAFTDGNNNTIRLDGWKRGIPQLIRHPATPDEPTGSSESAVVDDNGWVLSITDENTFTTTYQYDLPSGRLTGITYPQGGSTTWYPTTFSFQQSGGWAYGIAPGHWVLTRSTGNQRRVSYLDALWQPLVEESYDTTDVAGTRSVLVKRFDEEGRPTFQSYPASSLASHADSLAGVTTRYDSLGRTVETRQSSELGDLITATRYLPGLQTEVTSPRLTTTTVAHMAYDRPTSDWPRLVTQPEGVNTRIDRNIFGNPTVIRRLASANAPEVARVLVYDRHQQLCKRVEPETAATVMTYDGAGNIAWSASGQPQTSAVCDASSVAEAAKVSRIYDARNRLKELRFPSSNGSQAWSYYPDGQPRSVTTFNDAGASWARNEYTYNNRRLLTGESLTLSSGEQWALGYGYEEHGSLSSNSYPSGRIVDYLPNALGQPRKVGAYASGVSYYPNGAVKQFTYGNGIVHQMLQNPRQLPDRSVDSAGGAAVLDDSYDYDAGGNVAAITDGLPAHRGSRDLFYDGLDRLVAASSPMFGDALYGYDTLDNLKSVSIGSRFDNYFYDTRNLLTNIVKGDETVHGLDYDARGNLKDHDGQLFVFDEGNRLREVPGKEAYRYDGHGRRVQARHLVSGASIYSFYAQDGALRFQRDDRKSKATDYMYLAGSLVARVNYESSAAAPVIAVSPSLSNNGQYALQWTDVPATARYELQEQVDGGAWSDVYGGIGTARSFTNRWSGSYGYRVRACAASMCGGWSVVAVAVVAREPTVPMVLTAPSVGASGNYTVAWQAVPTATTYLLQEQAAGTWSDVYSGSGISKAFQNKPAGTYGYRAKACNAIGCGDWSSTITVEAVYAPASAPVLSSPTFNTTGGYSVNWSVVTGASSYQLEEQANGGAWTLIQNAGSTSASITGRASGTYIYRVRACNVIGCGPLSATSSTTVLLPPAGAPSISAPAASYNGSFTVTWGAVAAATRYQLEEQVNGSGWTLIHDAAANSLGVGGKGSASYGYRARGCNDGGCGPWSVTATVVVTLPPASAPSVSVPASSPSGYYNVSWTGVAGAATYQLEEQYNGGGWTLIHQSGAGSLQINARTDGTWGYRVRACNVGGCGPYSSTAAIGVTLPPQTAPTLYLDGYADAGYQYLVSWTAVARATSYQLENLAPAGHWWVVQDSWITQWNSPGQGAGLYRYRVRACNWAGCGPYSTQQVIEVRDTCPPPCGPGGGDPPVLRREDPTGDES